MPPSFFALIATIRQEPVACGRHWVYVGWMPSLLDSDLAAQSSRSKGSQFTTTHWSVVLAAGQVPSVPANAALEQLCHTYWHPLYLYVRRRGFDQPDAQDLTQEFFARLLATSGLVTVGRKKGKFRTFLLASLNHFLANEWKRERTLKRGGGIAFLSLDELDSENRQHQQAATELTPEKLYDRRWAQALLDQVLARLRGEYAAAGKAALFDHHTQPVNCVAFSPDGKRLATGSVGNPVQIWDTATGTNVMRLPDQNVVSLAFAPDGQKLGVGGRDQVVVWNLKTAHAVFKHEEALGRFHVAFPPKGTLLMIGKRALPLRSSEGGSAELWDYAADELKQVFPESGGFIALSLRGDRLATAFFLSVL